MWSLPSIETLAAASPCPSQQQQLIGSTPTTRSRRPLTLASHSPTIKHKKNLGASYGLVTLFLSSKRQGLNRFQKNISTVSCTMGMTEGDSAGPKGINLDNVRDKVKKFWEGLPQPVRSFPWPDALENFLELILGLVFEVAKYLSVPLLALTSLSELSYCAHEKKMRLIPIPLLVGIAMAGVFRDTTLEMYPQIKEGEFPWHLVAVASFFVLLKLPGPYYPYWGRIFIPHFANGGLLRSLWFSIIWYRRSRAAPETTLLQSSTHDQSQALSRTDDDDDDDV